MTEDWGINASPLILLGKLCRLDLLEKLAASVCAPQTVFDEVESDLAKDPVARLSQDWADSSRIADVPLVDSIIRWDLGSEESQVIAHHDQHEIALHKPILVYLGAHNRVTGMRNTIPVQMAA